MEITNTPSLVRGTFIHRTPLGSVLSLLKQTTILALQHHKLGGNRTAAVTDSDGYGWVRTFEKLVPCT